MEESSTSVNIENPIIKPPVSVKELQIQKLIIDLYNASIMVKSAAAKGLASAASAASSAEAAESAASSAASAASVEPQILSIFYHGYDQEFHKNDNDTFLNLQNYINFIMDQIFHNGITLGKNNAYKSAIILLTGIIVGTSIKFNIHINEILGGIVLANGHGGKSTISAEESISLNKNVNIIDFIHTVAEKTYGHQSTFNASKAFALKLYENNGKSLSHNEKKIYREFCSDKYNKLIKTNDMSINYRQRFLNQIKLDLEKDVEYKKKMIDIILNKPDLKHYYEETVEGKKIENIFKKLQENPNTHIDEYYNIFAKKLENDIAELEHFNDINKKSINTDKMLKSCKSETNKFEMCKNIQLLLNEQHDDLNSNLYTLFYILPDFIKSYSESAYIIRCMMNRILSEFQLRRRSLEARAKDTQPTTIFQNSLNGFDKFEQYEKEILENTDIFYDFAFFKDQKKFELNTTGFSYLFMSCLDQLFNKNPINIYEQSLFNVNKYGEIFINPAKFMSMIGKIVPNIKITYIVNSCRETNTDNPEFIVSSLENTPNVSPSGTPRQLGKKSLDKSPSDSQNETRRVSPGIKEKSLTPGGSRRGKFRRSTRRKRSNKSYRKYSIGNKKQTKYK